MKILMIGDLHYGEKGDSEKFNAQVDKFIDFAISVGKEKNVDAVVQFGDWFHQRNRIQVQTLTYGIEGARRLGAAFGRESVFVLEGNHDLFYLDRLDVSSVAALRPYVTIVDTPTNILPGIYATPWVATEDIWGQVIEESNNHDYLFAHLELNGFMVNERYVMEHGRSHRELKRYKTVYSGHYHSCQEVDNVVYLGTPYPITMNEANESHGVFILDTDTGTHEYVEYTGVNVISIPYTEIDSIVNFDPENTTVRIEFPDDLDDETKITDAQEFLKENNFSDYKIKYRGEKAKKIVESVGDDIENVENIDEAVVSFLRTSPPVSGVCNETLIALYTDAIAQEVKN